MTQVQPALILSVRFPFSYSRRVFLDPVGGRVNRPHLLGQRTIKPGALFLRARRGHEHHPGQLAASRTPKPEPALWVLGQQATFAVPRAGHYYLRSLTPVPSGSDQPGVRSCWGSSPPRTGRTSQMALSPALWGPGREEEAFASWATQERKGNPRTMAWRLSQLPFGNKLWSLQPSPCVPTGWYKYFLQKRKRALAHGSLPTQTCHCRLLALLTSFVSVESYRRRDSTTFLARNVSGNPDQKLQVHLYVNGILAL